MSVPPPGNRSPPEKPDSSHFDVRHPGRGGSRRRSSAAPAAEQPPDTHYAVVAFAGDPTAINPEPDLHGQPPSLTLLARGTESFCWEFIGRWMSAHPLRAGETAEVLTPVPKMIGPERAE